MWIQIINEGVTIPAQGWKLHVSASVLSAEEVLQRTLPVLLAEDASFKVAASLTKLDYLNHGQGGLTQIGKFITVYPNDDAQAVHLANSLHEVTQGHGLRYPAVPSDRPLMLGSLVHYRYGNFANQFIQTPMGQVLSAISNTKGELFPDHRRTSYSVVDWVVDPFIKAGVAKELPPENPLINGRYLLIAMVHQSASGGVYLATDIVAAQTCILKRARRDAGIDRYGRDARDRLRWEAEVLRRLAHNPSFPKSFDLIERDEDLFLVMQDIDGETLEQHVGKMRAQGLLISGKQIVTWGRELAELLATIHAEGFIYRDLKSPNVIVSPQGQIYLVDFDNAYELTSDLPPIGIGTRGYMSPQQEAGQVPAVTDDIYGLGALLYFMATGAEPSHAPVPLNLLNISLDLLNPAIAPNLANVIARCLHSDPAERFPSMEVLDAALRAIEEEEVEAVPLPFGTEPVLEPDEDMECHFRELAHQLGNTICAVALSAPNEQGLTWSSSHDLGSGTHALDLNVGNAGVVLALAELVSELGDAEHRAVLAEGARWLNLAPHPGRSPLPGLYVGEAGIGAALLRAGQVLGDRKLITSALVRGQWISSQSYASPDLFNGTAGRLRFHIWLWDETGASEHLRAAIAAGESLLATAEDTGKGGLCWTIPPGYDSLSGSAYLGYAHGAAGIADALLDLFEVTNDERFLIAAQGAGRWLARQAVPALEDGSGLNWPDVEEEAVNGAFWCRGATGIGRFFLHAAALNILPEAANLAERAARTVARGGRWNSPTQCHGLAGNIEFLLDMYQTTSDRAYLTEAWSLAHLLKAFGVERDGKLVWPSEAPTTFTPDYMVGYSGVLVCLLRLNQPKHLPHQLSRLGFCRLSEGGD
ncbi:MAG: class IV lanthionine synthetase LanL [Xenococcaceae cyanobacterium MO_234.B1]|nr:class IV lanthionine synthetase LanL [Xenococcaceae cyanobacterium MO_234.B1]